MISKNWKPEKPSAILKFALEALREWEQIEGREVDMETYHQYEDGVCYACLGGAAAVKLWNFDPIMIGCTEDGMNKTGDKSLRSFEYMLDSARKGEIDDMFYRLGLPPDDGLKYNLHIIDYHEDRDGFYRDMEGLVDDLKRDGW